MTPRAGGEVVGESSPGGGRPGRVVGAVKHDERPAAHDLEPARNLEVRERIGDDGLFDGSTEECLRRSQRGGCIVALVGSVQGDVDLVVAPRRGVEINDATAVGEPVGVGPEVGAAPPERCRADPRRLVLDHAGDLRVILPEDDDAARLHDAGLLGGDLLPGGTEQLDVVELHIGDHSHRGIDDVRRIPAPAEADLDNSGLDSFVSEPAEGGCCDELEPRRPHPDEHFELGQGGQLSRQGVISDLQVADHHPLVDPLEMRARVDAGLDPARP